MKKKLFIVAMPIIMLLISCGQENDTIRIGAVLPMTGTMAGQGSSIKSGLQIAIEELNNNSNIKYELLVEDVASEQKNVLNAYRKLKNNNVSIFVTTGSAFSLALKPSVIKDDNLIFCVASHPDITAGGDYNIFKVGNSSVDESLAISQYVSSQESNKTVLFYPNTEYGIPFYETIRKSSDNILSIKYDESDLNYRNIVNKALSEKPSIIVAIGFTKSLGLIIKELRDSGYSGPIISNTGFASTDVQNTAGDAKKGVIYVDYKIGESINTIKRDSISLKNEGINFSSICFLAYSIPYFINKAVSSTQKIDTKLISNEIRKDSACVISSEYDYSIAENGDIKPILILKEYK